MTFRRLKKEITTLLQAPNLTPGLAVIVDMPADQAVNPLFSLLYHHHDQVRWRAVTAIGLVVAALADRDPAPARVYMRRLMWHLNDESGGIGWGSPEAMGEIMARHCLLAREYAAILISYLAPWGNYLEHEPLQQGVLWAVGRLGRSRPHRVHEAGPLLLPFLSSPSPSLRGLAAWAAGPVLNAELKIMLEGLKHDSAEFTLYWEEQLSACTIATATEASLSWDNKKIT